ncbi:MAG: hypothetical protein ACKVKW_01555 [Flavobacteriales bacterium]|jgi:hypothetical protein|tara:strand:- start:5008 stop:5790 length:783 start_codon:yes stop_codon:yes gene_type:complete
MKYFFSLSLIAIVIVACNTTIIPTDQEPEDRNIVLRHFFYYGNGLADTTTRFEMGNAEVKFREVALVFSNYYFTDHLGDTLLPDFSDSINPPVFDPVVSSIVHGTDVLLFSMPKGTYSGDHHFRMGLDSAQDFKGPGAYGSEHDLAIADIYRGDNDGYNGMLIKGLYRDVSDTVNLAPYLPFTYRIPAQGMMDDWSKQMMFNITSEVKLNMNVVVRLDSVLRGFDPLVVDDIMGGNVDVLDEVLSDLLHTQLLDSYKIQI